MIRTWAGYLFNGNRPPKKLGRLANHELHRSARSFIRVNPCDPWLPHFAKGNPAAKESIDRISGSGVFARDPDRTRRSEPGCGAKRPPGSGSTEQVIESGWATFVQVGLALATIKDNELYRTVYGSFEHYCRVKWHTPSVTPTS